MFIQITFKVDHINSQHLEPRKLEMLDWKKKCTKIFGTSPTKPTYRL